MHAVVVAFCVPPMSTLRDEIDGLHAEQCEAVLRNLKLATTYMTVSLV
jgi:hypothetical protein